MDDKVLGLLGLMRRAGAIELGEDNSAAAVKAGKAKILLMSADVSDSAKRKAEGFSNGRNVQLIPMNYSRAELGSALGVGNCAMAVLTDMGFSNALMKELSKQHPELYADAASETEQRFQKAKKRKSESTARGTFKRNVKRRTEV